MAMMGGLNFTRGICRRSAAVWFLWLAVVPTLRGDEGSVQTYSDTHNTSRLNAFDAVVSDRFPNRAVGKIVVFDYDVVTECTGVLVAPSLVLSSAGCTGTGIFTGRTVTFIPASELGDTPFGSWRVESIAVTSDVTSEATLCDGVGTTCFRDLALLRLEEKPDFLGKNQRLGDVVGWLSTDLETFDADHSAGLASRSVTVLSYADDYDNGTRLQRTDALASQEGLFSEAHLGFGLSQPGAPWLVHLGEPASRSFVTSPPNESNRVVAIGSGTDIDGRAVATRLTPSTFGELFAQTCAQYPEACDVRSNESTEDPAIRLSLESPAEGGVYSGVGTIRGWAVHPYQIEKIELSVDGGVPQVVPLGAERADVGAAFPGIRNSENSGFGMAYNYGNLTPGTHQLSIMAYTINGRYTETSVTFDTVKFQQEFVSSAEQVLLDDAKISGVSDKIVVEGLSVGGQRYDAELQWDTASQQFLLNKILVD